VIEQPSTSSRTIESAAIAATGKAFASAERPVLLLGQGAFGCAERLTRLVETCDIPFVTTPAARGVIPEDHPLSIPFDPLRGNLNVVNSLFEQADLVLALGCKLGHNGSVGFQLKLLPDRLIHVDAEPGTAGANYDTRIALTARVEDVIGQLETRQTPAAWDRRMLADIRARVRTPDLLAETRIQGGTVTTPAELFSWLRGALPRDAIVVTDSGFHQILTRRHFDVLAPRGLIVPNDLQSMGYGLPAAIGAKMAAPERPVVAIIGDGGFLMSGLELLTAHREQVGLTVIVFNDGHLNQIRLHQLRDSGYGHAVDLANPDFEALAAAFGIAYARFGDASMPPLREILHAGGPTLIEVVVGDSAAVRRTANIARAKGVARAVLGQRIKDALRGLRQKRA
jgi:acetolactate synthase-1/2/3 large subunit